MELGNEEGRRHGCSFTHIQQHQQAQQAQQGLLTKRPLAITSFLHNAQRVSHCPLHCQPWRRMARSRGRLCTCLDQVSTQLPAGTPQARCPAPRGAGPGLAVSLGRMARAGFPPSCPPTESPVPGKGSFSQFSPI